MALERRVVFVHGGAVDHRSWDLAAERLGDTYRVVRPIRPSVEEIATGLGQGAILVGASMGGGLALEAAARFPDLVERLVLVAPMVPVAPVSFDEDRMQAFARAASNGPVAYAAALLEDPWFTAGLIEPAAREALRLVLEENAPGRHGQAAWRAPRLTADAVARLPVPTVIVVGDLDDPANIAMSAWTAEHIPEARLLTATGSGHLVELVRPDVIAGAITDWLPSERPSASG